MWVMLLFSAIFLLLLFGCTDRDETIEQLMDSALGHIEHSKAKLLYDEIFEIEIPTDEKYDVEELKREMEYAEENTK
ncbi:hypothetical protein [Ornithinibacillus scapharcae]|uniref:hypothetical protein n=1 Tax=Ornithinibacillus scapharcae TaxID=1147159 RepID=UPI001300BF2E|nr:hypothetical protein [Ornithinibacillus scapharcae]